MSKEMGRKGQLVTIELPLNARREKTCKKCRIPYTDKEIDVVFRRKYKKGANSYSHYLRPICRQCDQDARTDRDEQNRWRAKATRVRQSHAKKFGLTTKQLENDYGWGLGKIARQFEHASKNGCSHCEKLYSQMPDGHGAISLDIWDRRIEPDYSNTRVMCRSCNLAKGIMTPEEWGIYTRLYRQRERIFAERAKTPKLVQMDLFS